MRVNGWIMHVNDLTPMKISFLHILWSSLVFAKNRSHKTFHHDVKYWTFFSLQEVCEEKLAFFFFFFFECPNITALPVWNHAKLKRRKTPQCKESLSQKAHFNLPIYTVRLTSYCSFTFRASCIEFNTHTVVGADYRGGTGVRAPSGISRGEGAALPAFVLPLPFHLKSYCG